MAREGFVDVTIPELGRTWECLPSTAAALGLSAADDAGQALVEAQLYDPADHTVTEVEEYLETADEAEKDRVLTAERAGKNRSSLTD